MPQAPKSVLALDVGARRIGVAVATLAARLPRPLTTLTAGETFWDGLKKLIETENAEVLVVGLPRGLSGQHTQQTNFTQNFAAELTKHFNLPIHWQDESVTSKKAEEELERRGRPYSRADIDALAATYILEDFLTEHKELTE